MGRFWELVLGNGSREVVVRKWLLMELLVFYHLRKLSAVKTGTHYLSNVFLLD